MKMRMRIYQIFFLAVGVLCGAAGLVPAAASAAEQAANDIDRNIAVLKKGNKVDAQTLIAAAEALGEKGPAAAKAVPDLIASFRRPLAVRQAAIQALAKIGAPAVPPLLELLDGRDSSNAMRLGYAEKRSWPVSRCFRIWIHKSRSTQPLSHRMKSISPP